jgi:hypothetical protein
MFTMFEPKTFPIDTPMVSGFTTENTATNSSGKDVEKATRMNPTVVFPNPVALATFIEWVIVRLLALSKTTNATIRIMTLPSRPNPSST